MGTNEPALDLPVYGISTSSSQIECYCQAQETDSDNIFERGFVYLKASSGDPTVSSNDGSESETGFWWQAGPFSETLTGLDADSDYRVRAYAEDEDGYGYSDTITVHTMASDEYLIQTAFGTIVDVEGGDWNNKDNVKTDNTSYAEADFGGDLEYAYLKCLDLNTSIPSSASIQGIACRIRYVDGNEGAELDRLNIVLEGTVSTTNVVDPLFPDMISAETWILGGRENLWGEASITPSQLNSSTTGIHLRCDPFANEGPANIEYIELYVYYTIEAHTLTSQDVVAGAAIVSKPSISQDHSLTSQDIVASAAIISKPSLGVSHVLLSRDIIAAPAVVTKTDIGQAHVLAFSGVEAAPAIISKPGMGQVHALTSQDIEALAAVISKPGVNQSWRLTSKNIEALAAVISKPGIGHVHVLSFSGVEAAPAIISKPGIGQIHDLTSKNIEALAAIISKPSAGVSHVLLSKNIVASPAIITKPGITNYLATWSDWYLSELEADNDFTLDVSPTTILPLNLTKPMFVQNFVGGKLRALVINTPVAGVELQWVYASDTDRSTILDAFHNLSKGGGRASTFYWAHPRDGHTYTVRFMSPLRTVYKPGLIQDVDVIQLKIEGKKPI